jgi:hypothetical protein
MNKNTSRSAPALFWAVAIAAVIWNLLGVVAYLMEVTMSEEAMAALPEAQQALYAAQPSWVTGAFAIAVFSGLGGSIALAFRRSFATAVLSASLIAVGLQMFYVFALSNTVAVMGLNSAILPSLVISIGAALVWFSLRARKKGWTV